MAAEIHHGARSTASDPALDREAEAAAQARLEELRARPSPEPEPEPEGPTQDELADLSLKDTLANARNEIASLVTGQGINVASERGQLACRRLYEPVKQALASWRATPAEQRGPVPDPRAFLPRELTDEDVDLTALRRWQASRDAPPRPPRELSYEKRQRAVPQWSPGGDYARALEYDRQFAEQASRRAELEQRRRRRESDPDWAA
jgi:hypothetical protein